MTANDKIARRKLSLLELASDLAMSAAIYQQTFVDTYTKVACAKLYNRKTPITAADLLNDRVIPFWRSTMSC